MTPISTPTATPARVLRNAGRIVHLLISPRAGWGFEVASTLPRAGILVKRVRD
jgi:hypothetical protein